MAEPARKIAIYGKGGIGKSMVATNLSVCFARASQRVLHIGCDPKVDSAIRLMENPGALRTVLQVLGNDPTAEGSGRIINQGRFGIQCVEAGGPAPGVGCAGRGVARTVELFEDMELLESGLYDAVVFDVLGDVVCGGFASPLRQGFAERVFIVVSQEPMSLYAANNIARAVSHYADNGVALGGLIANLRDQAEIGRRRVEAFAERLSTEVVAVLERDPQVQEAEQHLLTVCEFAPASATAQALGALAEQILGPWTEPPAPTPLENEAFFTFIREH